jgi:transposase
MTLADQAGARQQDGPVTDETPAGDRPAKPKRRTFSAAYKARILAEYEALPEGSSKRGELLRRERLYYSHITKWRHQAQESSGAREGRKAAGGEARRSREEEELQRLREENKRLRGENTRQAKNTEKLSGELNRTKTALDIAGKAFALLQDISSSADSDEK